MPFWIELLSLRKLLTGLHVMANGTSLLANKWTPDNVRGFRVRPDILGMSQVHCQVPGKKNLAALIWADLFNPFTASGTWVLISVGLRRSKVTWKRVLQTSSAYPSACAALHLHSEDKLLGSLLAAAERPQWVRTLQCVKYRDRNSPRGP